MEYFGFKTWVLDLKPSNISACGLTEFFCKNLRVKDKPLSGGPYSGARWLFFFSMFLLLFPYYLKRYDEYFIHKISMKKNPYKTKQKQYSAAFSVTSQ